MMMMMMVIMMMMMIIIIIRQLQERKMLQKNHTFHSRTTKQKERHATHKGGLGESFKKKRGSNIMHDQYNRSADREFISEDTILWLLREI